MPLTACPVRLTAHSAERLAYSPRRDKSASSLKTASRSERACAAVSLALLLFFYWMGVLLSA